MSFSMRSQVRRLHLFNVEQVQHHQEGQEWVPHWHAEWSFGAIVAGECRCSVAGRPLRACAGDLVAIAPGVVHTGALSAGAGGGPVLVTMLYVPEAWLAQSGLALPARSGVVRAPGLCRASRDLDSASAVQDWLGRAVPRLARALGRGAGDGSGAAARVGMGAGLQGDADAVPGEAVRELLRRVQAAVLEGEQSVSGLAQRCEVSRERIHRVLRQWLGMAPADYLRAVRLHRARQLVLDGVPVAQVAAECGFADQAHFTRWFRRSFGYTPGDLVLAMTTGRR